MNRFQSPTKRLGSPIEGGQILNLNFMTSLGEPDPSVINKKDILSAMAFNSTGKLLAVGDHAGRCILFERQQAESN